MMKDKVAVITGAGSGIGLALTNQFLSMDDHTFVIAIGRQSSELRALCEKFNARLVIKHIDFNHTGATKRIEQALGKYERIDYLVHCAGSVIPLKRIHSIDYEDWCATQKVNSDIPFLITKLCLNKFKHSRVLFLTSDQPVTAVEGASAYCVSKAAIQMMCDCFRKEISHDIAAFATVAPGNVDTPMQKKIREVSSDVLPMSVLLRDMHKESKLLPPHLVAEYLCQLLTRIDVKTFGATQWNVLRSAVKEPQRPLNANSNILTTVDKASLQYLQDKIDGDVWATGSKEYTLRRRVFNQAISHFPIGIVVPQSEADIVKIIDYANRQNLQISIKGAGHGVTGAAVINGGIVIDMSTFQSIELCADGQSVKVGAGVRNRDLDRFLSHHNKVVPLGTCPDVGVVGATLGGGIGFLSRKYGLSCDNVLAFNLISADGQQRVVSASEHTDLFWALRGGGGAQFGVITDITFSLHPAPDSIEGGIIEWPIHKANGILTHYSETVLQGPRTQFLYAYIARSTAKQAKISIMGFSDDPDTSLHDITSWETDADISITHKQYTECQSNNYEQGHALYWRNGIIEGALTQDFITTVLQCFQSCPDNAGGIMLDPLCGAIQDVGAHETAFIHRNASFVCSITGVTPADQVNNEVTEWVDQTYARLSPFFNGYAYQNYDMGKDFPLIGYYGQHTQRLIAIKQKFDPELKFAGSLQRHLQKTV
ncbi:SDR family NAD(P)-dependent oxidoreductase [Alteromonas oceanisediminis]|uniref:SDR family NAD(P)-dependent oxidoreductase n=1 Tax=Alteromonas oceanisediminis TaxID=2836180 RepID=UPI001BDABBD1|nr:SDR family NAD(P)-dependent oxidoreductase [Alteromonas oceanisediminis]MBT0588029.1 SDR family NAD(P)-dependent oxidoreductase [Alteromonas oceanisediminis]